MIFNWKHFRENYKRKLDVFRKLRELRQDRTRWFIQKHCGWGDTIRRLSKYSAKGFSITGHLYGIETGDELILDMESGNQLSCVITTIRYENNPRDMFYGYAKPIEYLRVVKNINAYKSKKLMRES